jgi:hypothetical protein
MERNLLEYRLMAARLEGLSVCYAKLIQTMEQRDAVVGGALLQSCREAADGLAAL